MFFPKHDSDGKNKYLQNVGDDTNTPEEKKHTEEHSFTSHTPVSKTGTTVK